MFVGKSIMICLRYSPQEINYLQRWVSWVAMESIEQTFNGQANWGKKVTATVSRNGDLIHRTYLRVQLPDVSVPNNTGFRWVNWLGHALVKTVEVEIGGQRIECSA